MQTGLGEECDLGSQVVPNCDDVAGNVGVQFCASDCTFDALVCPDVAVCGDGDLDLDEACDDGNNMDGDGCSADCQSEACGNGSLDTGEACDGSEFGGATCSDYGFVDGPLGCFDCMIDVERCYTPTCSDGILHPPEQCDDGNRTNGDGCDRRCRLEECGDTDADEDGVGDECDQCPEGDDTADADLDGVADACDVCPGFDDSADDDSDGFPDGCDICPAGDDLADDDSDGVPDACDICSEGDDSADADMDTVPDACDLCPEGDDFADDDSDGVPDVCDVCAGEDDLLDDDADGVPNGCDICLAGDDFTDTDTDMVPDACDICPLDINDDSDMDGVCDSDDQCPNDDSGSTGGITFTVYGAEGPLIGETLTITDLDGVIVFEESFDGPFSATRTICLPDGNYVIGMDTGSFDLESYDGSVMASSFGDVEIRVETDVLWACELGRFESSLLSIGWNFVADTPAPGVGTDVLDPCDIAGRDGARSWNNHQANAQAPGDPMMLVDSHGRPTGITASWTLDANNSWSHGETGSPDQRMMSAFTGIGPTVTFDGVPSELTSFGYSLYIYLGNNETGGPVDIVVNGTTVLSGVLVGPNSFTDDGEQFIDCRVVDGTPCNFVYAYVPDNTPTLTVEVNPTGGNQNTGITGIQILEGD